MTAHRQAAPQPSGTLTATVAADGRWPKLATRGGVLLETCACPGSRSPARRRAGRPRPPAPQAPLEVQAEDREARTRRAKLDRLQLRIDGTAAEHRIAIDGASPVRPPRWIDLVHGADSPLGSGTRLLLRAKGGLDLDPTWMQPLRWQGRLQQLQLARVDLASGAAQPACSTSPSRRSTCSTTCGPRCRASAVGAGRATLPNLALRWSGALAGAARRGPSNWKSRPRSSPTPCCRCSSGCSRTSAGAATSSSPAASTSAARRPSSPRSRSGASAATCR